MGKSGSRIDVLRKLRGNKNQIGLSFNDLSQLDRYLQDEWGIRLLDKRSRESEIAQLPNQLAHDYEDLHDKQAMHLALDQAIPPELEKRWYDLIAAEPLGRIVHSEKRTLILSGVAWIASLFKHLHVTSPVLDIGCHTGYQSVWLASQTGINVDAVDRSAAAIAYGRQKATGLPNVEFQVWDYDKDQPQDRFYDAIICSDAMPDSIDKHRSFLQTMSDLLNDQGILILIGDLREWSAPEPLHQHTIELGLGFGIGDVIGGWDGSAFTSKFVLALLKGGPDPFPLQLPDVLAEGWDRSGFPKYANDSNVAPTEKSLAYFRASQRVTPGAGE